MSPLWRAYFPYCRPPDCQAVDSTAAFPREERNRPPPRSGLMVKHLKSQSDEWALPVFLILSAILAVVGSFWLLLFHFSQPAIYPNPGLAAYVPPPGTRLLPLLRKSDAPELANLPDEPPPLAALAQAQDQKMFESPARRRPRVAIHENNHWTSDYRQQWNSGQGDWSGNRAWSSPRKMSGGPKSSF